jgi:WD40 repeat protein
MLAVAFARDSRFIAVGQPSGRLNIYDTRSGKWADTRRFLKSGLQGDVVAADFSLDGSALVAGDTTGRIHIWPFASKEVSAPPTVLRHETSDLKLSGLGYEPGRLDDGERAFLNRNYVWSNVPNAFKGWHVARTSGGRRAEIRVRAKRDTTLHIATAQPLSNVNLEGWRETAHRFNYTDSGRTSMLIFTRELKQNEELLLPQGNWTGVLLLTKDPIRAESR